MRSTCTSRRSSWAPASASTTTRLTTGSSGFAGAATPIRLRRSTCGTGPSLPVDPQPSRQAVANLRRKEPVLRQVAEGVLIHQSAFCQSNAVVVHGRAGVLLIDPGVLGFERAALANDLRELGQPVVAGFSTHPHWDHLLWHARLGAAPRYGTARCAAIVRVLLSDVGWKARIAEWIPPDIAEQGPPDLLGLITTLPP